MQNEMRKIPGVDKLLVNAELKNKIDLFGTELVTFCVRQVITQIRTDVLNGGSVKFTVEIVDDVISLINNITKRSLLPMINCTGVILHTNLGRAPFSDNLISELSHTLSGYSNLEFNLNTGSRGQRNDHISEILRYVTKAEDAVVVNNNAAAVMLALKTCSAGAEAIISRGELVEVGGSFRIPDVMAASGAIMVEVGATNRTRLSDYENAITSNTKVILKVHKSNYHISGFTEEVGNAELVKLAKKHNLTVIYDMGSGLLRKPESIDFANEPDVYSALKDGVDIVTFSGDKLLGGPQAGIIAGKKKKVEKIQKDPMMRALRVGKMTYTALAFVIKSYLKESELKANIPLFMMLERSQTEINNLAVKFGSMLNSEIDWEICHSSAQVGGGTLPHVRLDSKAIKIKNNKISKKIFDKLLEIDKPILAILREGNINFDMITVFEKDLEYITDQINEIYRSLM